MNKEEFEFVIGVMHACSVKALQYGQPDFLVEVIERSEPELFPQI